MRRTAFALSVVFSLSMGATQIESVGPAFSRDPIGQKTYAAAPRIAERAGLEPMVRLAAAAEAVPEELAAIAEWNDAGRMPLKNGFTRPLGETITIGLETALAEKGGQQPHARGIASVSDRGTLLWSGAVRVDGADRVRLHLSNVKLPDGATLWVSGNGEAPIGFGRELVFEGSLYTPSVSGPVVYLEIEIPSPKTAAEGASFEIRELVELVAPRALRTTQPRTEDVPSCLIDATCVASSTFDEISSARAAVAHLQYVKGGNGFVCSGGLVNDKVTESFIPYLLTANHCFDSQASATTLEAYFDYKAAICNGASPSFGVPSLGATLLATNSSSDFTFVRLNSIPGGRAFLGWTTAPQPDGTKLHRVSHPFPDAFALPAPQRYSSSNVTSTFGTCTSLPLSSYLYSTGGTGGTYGGSSGAPVLLAGGIIVGQLLGSCGTNLTAGCDKINNAYVDGRFSATFPSIQQYINTTGNTPLPCTPSSTKVCLNNDRFSVSVAYKAGSQSGTATAIEYTPDSALFWFFGASNIEMILKTIDGCGLNSRFWVFAAATTDVEYTITVTDTQKGTTKSYFHAQGSPAPAITDTDAFACP
jgi:hypothetical protein